MTFSSMEFLLYFLPLFFFFYALTPKEYKNLTLLIGSVIFYVQGRPEYLAVLFISICVNFWFGWELQPTGKKKSRKKSSKKKKNSEINKSEKKKEKLTRRELTLIVLVVLDAAVLCGFKLFGQGMPLGMSFYTFQVISYLVDVYRGDVQREESFLCFLVYLMMFPKMGSGPITEYGAVKKELKEREVSPEKLQEGLKIFVLGLAAKVLLADRLGILWNDLQVAGYEGITTALAWIGSIAFSLKLYFDFYGYSLMAVGLGKMVGFDLPDNFRTPYLSRSVKEFYRRWHMTLGQWFLKYVYIPLGGSRKGEGRTIVNLLIVWLLTGFWHGSGANYILWGLFLGLCIIGERLLGKVIPGEKIKVLPHLYLWVVIPVSWMFFAITDLSQLQIYLERMFGFGEAVNVNPMDWYLKLKTYGYLLAAGVLCSSGLVEVVFGKFKNKWWMNLLLTALFWLCVWRVLREGNNPFMYLNF